MANGSDAPTDRDHYWRHWLALIVISASLIGMTVLAVTIVQAGTDKEKTGQIVLTAVLPLLGAWVGTVIAFYFSRENLEAATRSVKDLVKEITPQDRLRSVPVKDKMIPKDRMFFKTTPEDKIKLVDTLKELEASNKGQRLPVLDAQGRPKYIIHRSSLDRYLSQAAQSATPPDLKNLTLKDLVENDATLRKLFETSFATVREDGTLLDAKNAMDRTPGCQDVFVTKGGTKDEEVIGWLTNGIIVENAKV